MEKGSLLKLVFCIFLSSSAVGNALTIKEAEEKANQVCAACHGKDGVNGVLPSYPIIAGQYSD
ncbi:MAG: cytochrome c, partial [Burkholderiaceae bacterium]